MLQEYAHREILSLIDVLKSCANSEEAQPYVAKSIEKLARKGLLKGYLFERPDPPVFTSVDPFFHHSHNPLYTHGGAIYYISSEYVNLESYDRYFFDHESNDRDFARCATVCMMGPPPDSPPDSPRIKYKFGSSIACCLHDVAYGDVVIIHAPININHQGISFAVDFGNSQLASPILEEDIRLEDINNEIIEENIALDPIRLEEIRPAENWREIINVPENDEICETINVPESDEIREENEIIEENETNEIRENLGLEIDPHIINDFLDEYSQEKLLELTDALRKCANSKKAQPFVARAIYEMAEKGLFKEYSRFQILKLADALKECADAYEAKPDVAKAILYFAKKGSFDEFSNDEILKITDTLIKCAESESANLSVKEAISELIDKLISCAKEPSARQKVSETIADLANKGSFNGLSNDNILKITDALVKCTEEPSARQKVSEAVAILARKGSFNGLSNDNVLKIVDALKLCVNNNEAKSYVAISISGLASNNLLGGFENMVEMLDECLTNDSAPDVWYAVQVFIGENNRERYHDQTTDEGRRKVLDELVGKSLLKNLTDDGKEKLKDIIDRCVHYI